MKAHVIMKRRNHTIFRFSDEPVEVRMTRKQANKVAREKNEKSKSCTYYVKSAGFKDEFNADN